MNLIEKNSRNKTTVSFFNFINSKHNIIRKVILTDIFFQKVKIATIFNLKSKNLIDKNVITGQYSELTLRTNSQKKQVGGNINE